MEFLNSTAVKVFPTAHRAGTNGNESAFRLSEKHIGELLSLPLREKFVKEVSGSLFIVLKGHIFEISKSAIEALFPSSSTEEIWAHVEERFINADFGYELAPVGSTSTIELDDTNNKFKGIGFSDSAEDDSDLLVLVYDDGEWFVPESSKVVLDLSKVADDAEGTPVSDYISLKNVHITSTNNATATVPALKVDGGVNILKALKVGTTLEVGTNPTTSSNITGTITRAISDRDGRAIDATYATSIEHPSTSASDLNKIRLKNGDASVIGSTITINNVEHTTNSDNVYVSGNTVPAVEGGGYLDKIYFVGSSTSTTGNFETLHEDSTIYYKPSTQTLVAPNFSGKASNVTTKSQDTTYMYVVGVNSGATTTLMRNSSVVISSSGDFSAVNITASSFNASSDRRLKENIKEFHCEKSILDLPVVEFKYKNKEGKHIGCIAQDLQEICPELVHEDKDGYLSIEEGKLVYLLLDEVKKLRKEIESFKREE